MTKTVNNTPQHSFARWQNFSQAEMACRHCGEVYHWPEFMDRLQKARDIAGTPFHILSAHR